MTSVVRITSNAGAADACEGTLTITQLAALTAAELTNNDLAPEPVTIVSGVDPVTLDPSVPFYAVTTGGTGGLEILDLPMPALNSGGTNPAMSGLRVRIMLAVRTDSGDVVKITCGGSENISVCSNIGWGTNIFTFVTVDGEQLNFVGAMAVLEFAGDHWVTNPYLCDGESDTEYLFNTLKLMAGQTFFNGVHFYLPSLPTSDPGNANQLYIDGALALGVPRTLMVSGG